MNKLAAILFLISAMTAPSLSYAQSNTCLTRAQVFADLVRIEKAGYSPSAGDDSSYPADIQSAEARVAAEDTARMSADPSISSPTAAHQ